MYGMRQEQCLMIWQTISLSVHAAGAAFNVACPTCGIQLPVTFPLSLLTCVLVFLKCLGKGSFAATNLFQENNDNVPLYEINMKGKRLVGLLRRVKVREIIRIVQSCLLLVCMFIVLTAASVFILKIASWYAALKRLQLILPSKWAMIHFQEYLLKSHFLVPQTEEVILNE